MSSPRSIRLAVLVAATILAAPAAEAGANEFEVPLKALATSTLVQIAAGPQVIDAVRAQNAAHADITEDRILELDATWRAQVGAGSAPMLDEVMANSASDFLRTQSDMLGGVLTEVFVTDEHGLNVAQSTVTSDYWQGDEEKFTAVYGLPAGSIHLGEVEFDESTQVYQSQVSMPVVDPDTGAALGTITFGVNLALLQ